MGFPTTLHPQIYSNLAEAPSLLRGCGWGNFFHYFHSYANHNESLAFILNKWTHASCFLNEKELSSKYFFFFFKPISGVRQLTMGSGGREEVRSPESSSLSLWGHQLGCLPVLCESLGFLFETSAPNSKDPLATAQEGTKDVLPRCGLRIKIGGRPSSGQTTWLVPFPQDGGRVISECVDTSLCWPGK